MKKVEQKTFFGDITNTTFSNREQCFVSLATVHSKDINQNESLSDHEFNLRTIQPTKSIEIEDIVDKDDRITLVRGIGGIGKSSLVEYLTFQWSNGNLYKDINYIYLIRCRDISNVKNLSIVELLKENYSCLEKFTNDDIDCVARKTLIIFDGFDELSINDRNDISQTINNTQGYNFIITSRPVAMLHLFKNVKSLSPRLIDILGFTETNINIFIENYYKTNSNKKEKIRNFKLLMEHNVELKSFASIPLYLHTLLTLNNYLNENDFPDTKVYSYLQLLLQYNKITKH